MKKLIAFLLTLCLLPVFASAEMTGSDYSVALEGASFTFVPPQELVCMTRESSASVFGRVGLSQRDVVPSMEALHVYALLTDETISVEIQLIAVPTEDGDYIALKADEAESTRAGFAHYYQTFGFDVQSCEVYDVSGGHRFIRTAMSAPLEDGTPDYSVEYLTCHGGYALSITLYTYESAPTQEQLALCDALADSLRITADVTGE